MSNFTPGPWKISRTAVSIENTEANAHLIAAAPELYKACKMAIEATGGSKHWQGETEKFLLAMETALAKAEGKEA